MGTRTHTKCNNHSAESHFDNALSNILTFPTNVSGSGAGSGTKELHSMENRFHIALHQLWYGGNSSDVAQTAIHSGCSNSTLVPQHSSTRFIVSCFKMSSGQRVPRRIQRALPILPRHGGTVKKWKSADTASYGRDGNLMEMFKRQTTI